MAQIQLFEGPGLGASVLLAGEKEYLEIGKQGMLIIPPEVKPSGFHLVLVVPAEAQIVIVQKNVGLDRGGYHRHALAQLGRSEGNFITWVMHDPIQVVRAGKNVWTSWHSAKPNRIDCWLVDVDGHLDLFQVGVITHDDGQTFRLLGEYRWRGQLFQAEERIVGKPLDQKWGSFEVRRSILDDPDFQKSLLEAALQSWQGKPEELDPPLAPVPGPGYARMQWYSPFAGQTGQGPAILHNGSPAWVHGVDILDPPDLDGIKRLQRNDLVSYANLQKWGAKKEGPPKLLSVRRVQ